MSNRIGPDYFYDLVTVSSPDLSGDVTWLGSE